MWLISKRFDLFWLHAGLWLLPVLALGVVLPDAVRLTLVGGTMVFWLGHRFASAQTAYLLPEYRRLIRDEPLRFIAAPLLIFGAVIAFMWIPLGSDQYQVAHLRVLATIFFLINTYHFGIQHYGVVSIYQIKAKQQVSMTYRTQQRYLCLTLGGLLVAAGQLVNGAQAVRDSLLVDIIPSSSPPLLTVKIAGAVMAAITTIWWLVREHREGVRSWPKILYILGLGIQSLLAFVVDPLSFVLIWGLPHWLISVALAGTMAGRANASMRKGFLLSVGSLAVFSLVLAPLFYAVGTTSPMNPPSFYYPIMAVLGDPVAARLITAVAFASVYCHFVLDRAIFRFSHPKVRTITAPLLFGS